MNSIYVTELVQVPYYWNNPSLTLTLSTNELADIAKLKQGNDSSVVL